MRLDAAWLLIVATACGGATRGARRPAPPVDESSEEGEEAGFVAPEKFDEIAAAFRLKRPQVARCFSDAVERGKIPSKSTGRVSLGVTISAEGQPTGVHVTESTLKSEVVETCVIAVVKRWMLPPPGARTEFSFSYDLEPE